MRITCIGIDSASLYLGIRLKRNDPSHVVRYLEDAAAAAVPRIPAALVCNPLKPRWQLEDAQAQAVLDQELVCFDRVAVKADDQQFQTQGLPFASIDSAVLRERLEGLARGLGCEFAARPIPVDPVQLRDADLVVVADGPHSRTRDLCGAFQSSLSSSKTRFATFALNKGRDNLAYAFRATQDGIFHCYAVPRGLDGSCLIVEAPADVIRKSGADEAPPLEALSFCRALFPDELEGAAPSEGETGWREFVTVRNRGWHGSNLVILGSAAYTAHFSVGLDLRTWLEDAETLADGVCSGSSLPDALTAYERTRRPKAESLQRAAVASLTWFENVHRYIDKPFAQFVFSLLTNNMRINYPRLAKAAPALTRAVDDVAAGQPPGGKPPSRNRGAVPPMLTPYRLRELVLPNRIALSPMCMYSASDGTVNDFHLVHLGSRAMGGAGLVLTEMTDVLPEGRISLHCAGMYSPEHVAAWERVVKFVHAHSNSKIGIQLAHAGRKGALTRSWEGHRPLKAGEWEIIAPSPLQFAKDRQVPREMTRIDMDKVRDAFVRATQMSDAAGFDMIELHFAHGYLLSSFISPLSNQRHDEYGGSLANRMRFPLEVFTAVRAAWPAGKPISTRISAVDWVEGGTTIEDALEVARMLHDAGNDILAVSTGGVTSAQRPVDGRLYQASFSDQIRNALDIPTMAVGGIVSHGDANTVVAAGRADLCALARGYLVDPYFVRHAAYAQGYDALEWPGPYSRAKEVRMRGA
ncbi:MAG TPA: bifunctional salicylyl-CoA 5-hydroxylase/oxidoreductase [Xanthobacteraceae bacterium]|nr:bifunctional salicylyl-CoA 5-hydroxylase/oxidoreductase [Xanthobacteraceae bacterium]